LRSCRSLELSDRLDEALCGAEAAYTPMARPAQGGLARSMNSKQRVLAALENARPDRVPIFEARIDESVMVDLGRNLGADLPLSGTGGPVLYSEAGPESLDLYCYLVQELGLDATSYQISIGLGHTSDDLGRDKYGRVYRLSEHGDPMIVEGPIREPSDLQGYDMVAKLRPGDFANMQYIIDRVGGDKAHVLCINDPFKESWLLRGGLENLLMDYLLDPGLVHGLARITTDFSMAVVDVAAEMGVDILMLNGDLAGERSTFISPEHYREYVKPYQKEIVDHAHRKRLKIVKHTDGDAWSILDDFVEVGFDGFHPVQPQCMDLAEVVEHLAGKACVIGNIDCRDLLPSGTEEEVDRAVREAIETAAGGGGYIISSSNSVHPGCRAKNYLAMIRAAHKYGAASC